jgi:hypothetical protein
MVSMLSGSDDGLGGGLSCPEKDRCTNYSCAGGFLRVFREWISRHFPTTLIPSRYFNEAPRYFNEALSRAKLHPLHILS